ncbi:P-loop containing nucleoside triphosphate hydrolase protein [Blyttiomyces helicus]|uniref:P-loop containing nucleoside triphosphate hydrolase protein n=1 Tax=Blyttiomyces helicus TaxID=388810 RepID=A0A4P9WMZ7_9FUNG|nr:P-loop containing nucleoside triphosphate hydrolase protein [Blyttiomyces helicus]|eukprot:RKO92580.1 P-loop containing nucleoside triphosphate hydrolase protein [Blyttiomyces helicus]
MTETTGMENIRATSRTTPSRDRNDAALLNILRKLHALGVAEKYGDGNFRCILVGEPSSGKTSIVEAISGISFPRCDHEGVVTEIRMINGLPGSTFAGHVTTTVSHSDAKQVSAPEDIASAIHERRKDLARCESEDEGVLVEITSPEFPDLIIVDVPGLDEEFLDVIEESDSPLGKLDFVFLVVLPLSQVLFRGSLALNRIQKIDPTGKFTIGVLTKPDLLDDSVGMTISSASLLADACSLGSVMMLGRSQKDLDEGVRIDEAKDKEIAFFKAHPELSAVTDGRVGAKGLLALLARFAHLRRERMLPKLKEETRKSISSTSTKLAALGPEPGSNVDEKRAFLAKVWHGISEILSDGAMGRYSPPVFKNPELLLCARANALAEDFKAAVNATKPNFRSAEYVDDLLASGNKFSGSQLPGFVNKPLFDYRVARFVEQWKESAAIFSESIHGLVVAVARALLQELGSKVPKLVDHVLSILDDVARHLAEEGRERIVMSFKTEMQPFSSNFLFREMVERITCEKNSGKNLEMEISDFISKALDEVRDGVIHNIIKFAGSYGNYPFTHHAAHLSTSITASFETSAKENIIRTILDRLPFSSSGSCIGIKSAQAEADYLASMLEAYWHFSSTRLVDNVIGHVIKCVVQGFPTQLDLKVQALLSDHSAVLSMAEDSTREFLQDKIKGLCAVSEELAAL